MQLPGGDDEASGAQVRIGRRGHDVDCASADRGSELHTQGVSVDALRSAEVEVRAAPLLRRRILTLRRDHRRDVPRCQQNRRRPLVLGINGDQPAAADVESQVASGHEMRDRLFTLQRRSARPTGVDRCLRPDPQLDHPRTECEEAVDMPRGGLGGQRRPRLPKWLPAGTDRAAALAAMRAGVPFLIQVPATENTHGFCGEQVALLPDGDLFWLENPASVAGVAEGWDAEKKNPMMACSATPPPR
jgi:hypothetical protein